MAEGYCFLKNISLRWLRILLYNLDISEEENKSPYGISQPRKPSATE
jgi:hypothetical protein